MSIKENIKRLKSKIPSNVEILAATKNRSIAEVKEAIDAGIRTFGENYVQEAEKKYADLKKTEKIKLYFIGHLQKNKINRALRVFDLLVIDSLELAESINKRADKKVPVLIEVNIGNEPQKSGCKPEELVGLAKNISKLGNIEIKGLMAMAPYFDDAEKARPYFKKMRLLFESVKKLRLKNATIDVLSLGMSKDYKIAIEEGSNLIRIGSLIFQ
jgi:hypothetical protein